MLKNKKYDGVFYLVSFSLLCFMGICKMAAWLRQIILLQSAKSFVNIWRRAHGTPGGQKLGISTKQFRPPKLIGMQHLFLDFRGQEVR